MRFLKNLEGLFIEHPTKGYKQVKSIAKRGNQYKITFLDWDWLYTKNIPTGLKRVILQRRIELLK